MKQPVKPMTLQERMKAQVNAAPAASMIPDFTPPTPKAEAEVIPDAREVIESDLDRVMLARLCAEHVEWGAAERAAKAAKKPLTEKIKAILARNRASKLMIGDIKANYFNAPRKSLSMDLLLANGVTPAVITKSTVTKDAYTLKLTGPGQEEDEE